VSTSGWVDCCGPPAAVTLLKQRGVTSIDLVAVGHHHHQDHYAGMEAVIREFRPRLFLAPHMHSM
jgi:beta-lactamase superfamily II metal-dependent hydrolase